MHHLIAVSLNTVFSESLRMFGTISQSDIDPARKSIDDGSSLITGANVKITWFERPIIGSIKVLFLHQTTLLLHLKNMLVLSIQYMSTR